MKKKVNVILLITMLFVILSCKKDKDDDNGNTALTVTDIDGNIYKAVAIGTQVWMAENLKTTQFNDATDIPLVVNNTDWSKLSTPGYCWYDNDDKIYKNLYGALYNWYAVNTGKLCPKGWHVPSDSEWKTLTDFLGGDSIAGGKMRETGTTQWKEPNTGATNSSGFNALPAGARNSAGFGGSHYWAWYWSSTEYNSSSAWDRGIQYMKKEIISGWVNKENGMSIRCIKD